jgi:hypothetical protein
MVQRLLSKAALADLETEIGARGDLFRLDRLHSGKRRTFAQAGLQVSKAFFGSLGDHLDAAVRQVPCEPGEASLLGLSENEVAKADALDPTAHAKPECRHVRPPKGRSLSHAPGQASGGGPG